MWWLMRNTKYLKIKKVQLLEVNHTPSFTADTPFDHDLKFNVIKDTINLMNFNENDK